jgi:DNA-binding IclR family transcriptional regulator
VSRRGDADPAGDPPADPPAADPAAAVPSPPTQRVVAVVELLLAASRPLAVSEITQALGLNRSTCSAILGTLAERGWVTRLPDLAYAPGPGLIPLAQAVRERLPIAGVADGVVRRLASDTGYMAGLSRVERDEIANLIFVEPHPSGGPKPQPRPLVRLPLLPPMGAVTVAFSEPDVARAWLDRAADARVRGHLRRFLDSVRAQGVGVWRFDRVGAAVAARLGDLVAASGRPGAPDPAVRAAVADTLLALGRHGYTTEELTASNGPLPIALVAAPIFDEHGVPRYELELHVLQAKVSSSRLRALARRVRVDADALSAVCGGAPERPAGTWPWT